MISVSVDISLVCVVLVSPGVIILEAMVKSCHDILGSFPAHVSDSDWSGCVYSQSVIRDINLRELRSNVD